MVFKDTKSLSNYNSEVKKRKGAPTPISNGPLPGREALGAGFGASLNKIIA
jgi:hypothetical protein